MINNVSSAPSLGDTPDRQPQSGQQPLPLPYEQRPQVATPSAAPPQDTRIIAETDPVSGELNYSLVNRQTGEVTRVTKDDLARLSQDPSYSAGALFDAKA